MARAPGGGSRDIDIALTELEPFERAVLAAGGTATPWSMITPGAADRAIQHRPPDLINRGRLDDAALANWAVAYSEALYRPRRLADEMVFTLPGALMLPGGFTVLTGDHQVLTTSYRRAKFFRNFRKGPGKQATISVPRYTEALAGPVASVGPMEFKNFYHWMTEGFPRAHMLRKTLMSDFQVLIPLRAPGYVAESLALAGIGRDQLIFGDRSVYRCELGLFATTPVANIIDLSPWLFQFFRNFTRRYDDLEVAGVGEDILISRADAKMRRLVNEDELLAALGPSFSLVRLERLSLPEQWAVVRRARRIVSPHGAGLTHLLVANPDVSVVELMPDTVQAPSSFWAICDQRGLRYGAALGRARNRAWHNSDFEIDPGSIDDVLAFLGT